MPLAISRCEGMSDAMVGTPMAIPSKSGSPNPSAKDGLSTAAQLDIRRASVGLDSPDT